MPYEQTRDDFDKLAEILPFWSGALTACIRDGLDTAQTRSVLVKCAQSDPVLLEEFNEIAVRLSSGDGLLKQAESWDQYWKRTRDWKYEPPPPQRVGGWGMPPAGFLNQPSQPGRPDQEWMDASEELRAKWDRYAENLLTPEEQHHRKAKTGGQWELLERAVRQGKTPWEQKRWEATTEGKAALLKPYVSPTPLPPPPEELPQSPEEAADWSYNEKQKLIEVAEVEADRQVLDKHERSVDWAMRQNRRLANQQVWLDMPYEKYKGEGLHQLYQRPGAMLSSAGHGFVDLASTGGSTIGGVLASAGSVLEKAWGGSMFAEARDDYWGNAGAQITSVGENVANIFTVGEYKNSWAVGGHGTNRNQRSMDAVTRRNLKYKTGYDKGTAFWQKDFWSDPIAGFDRFSRGGLAFAAEFAMPGAMLKSVSKIRGAGLAAGTLSEMRGVTLIDDAITAFTAGGKFGDKTDDVIRVLDRISKSANNAALAGNAAGATKRIELAVRYMNRIGATTKQVAKFEKAALLALEHADGMNVLKTTVTALRASGEISDDAWKSWNTLSETQRAAQAAYPTLAKFQQIKHVPLLGKIPGVNKLLRGSQALLSKAPTLGEAGIPALKWSGRPLLSKPSLLAQPGAGLGQTSRGSHILRNLDRAQIIKNSPWYKEIALRGTFIGGGQSAPQRTMIPGVRDLWSAGARMSGVPEALEHTGNLLNPFGLAGRAADRMSSALKLVPILHTVDDIVFGIGRTGYKKALRSISSAPGGKGSASQLSGMFGIAGAGIIGDQAFTTTFYNPIFVDPTRRKWLQHSGFNSGSDKYVPEIPGLTEYARLARVPWQQRQLFYDGAPDTMPTMFMALPTDHFRVALEQHVDENTGFLLQLSPGHLKGSPKFRAGWKAQVGSTSTRNENIPIEVQTTGPDDDYQISGGYGSTYRRPKHSLLATAQWHVADEYEATNILLHPMNSTMAGVKLAYQKGIAAYDALSTANMPMKGPDGKNMPVGTGIFNDVGGIKGNRETQLGWGIDELASAFRNNNFSVKPGDTVAAQHFVDQVLNPVHDRIVNETMYNYYNAWFRRWDISKGHLATGDQPLPEQFALGHKDNMFDTVEVDGKETFIIPLGMQRAVFDPETQLKGHALQYHVASMNAQYQLYEQHVTGQSKLSTAIQELAKDSRGELWFPRAKKFYENVQADWHAKIETARTVFPHLADAQIEGVLRSTRVEGGTGDAFQDVWSKHMPEMEYIIYKGQVILRPEASPEVETSWEHNPAGTAEAAPAPEVAPTAQAPAVQAPVPMPEGLPGLPMP